jgi:hypothetical protein
MDIYEDLLDKIQSNFGEHIVSIGIQLVADLGSPEFKSIYFLIADMGPEFEFLDCECNSFGEAMVKLEDWFERNVQFLTEEDNQEIT